MNFDVTYQDNTITLIAGPDQFDLDPSVAQLTGELLIEYAHMARNDEEFSDRIVSLTVIKQQQRAIITGLEHLQEALAATIEDVKALNVAQAHSDLTDQLSVIANIMAQLITLGANHHRLITENC